MKFTLKFKDTEEIKEITQENYTIKNLLEDLNLSSQTIVAKQNGELSIDESKISDGDIIQLIQIIYGG